MRRAIGFGLLTSSRTPRNTTNHEKPHHPQHAERTDQRRHAHPARPPVQHTQQQRHTPKPVRHAVEAPVPTQKQSLTLERNYGPGHGYGQMLVRRSHHGYVVLSAYLPVNVEQVTRASRTQATPISFEIPRPTRVDESYYRNGLEYEKALEHTRAGIRDEFGVMEVAANTVSGVRCRMLDLDGAPVSAWRPYKHVERKLRITDEFIRKTVGAFTAITVRTIQNGVIDRLDRTPKFTNLVLPPKPARKLPAAFKQIAIPQKPKIVPKPVPIAVTEFPKNICKTYSRTVNREFQLPPHRWAHRHHFRTQIRSWHVLDRFVKKRWRNT